MTLNPTQLAEIETQRGVTHTTRRATVERLEEILYLPIPVLDHGFIRVIDYSGDDTAIAQAARVSYGRGTKTIQSDGALIDYLLRHRHTSPFEMCELKLHVKLPIFVARQWIRHRTANVNEYSARYSVLDREFYIPEPEHLAVQSLANKQGRAGVVPAEDARAIRHMIDQNGSRSYRLYELFLNDSGDGTPTEADKPMLARELSRMVMPLNTYTQWYWKVDLHNLLHFLSLRADPHAQYEIRAYADVLLNIVQKWTPIAYASFENHVLKGKHFSGVEMELLARKLRGENVTQETSGLKPGPWREFMAKLPPLGHHKEA